VSVVLNDEINSISMCGRLINIKVYFIEYLISITTCLYVPGFYVCVWRNYWVDQSSSMSVIVMKTDKISTTRRAHDQIDFKRYCLLYTFFQFYVDLQLTCIGIFVITVY